MHCQGNSLSLAVKSLTKHCEILQDNMDTIFKVWVLVKFSPKREKNAW